MKDLCSNIPASILLDQAIREVNRRQAVTYAKRMDRLGREERVFERCAQRRPSKGKFKNRASAEEAGTIGTMVVGVRIGKHRVVVCKTKKKY